MERPRRRSKKRRRSRKRRRDRARRKRDYEDFHRRKRARARSRLMYDPFPDPFMDMVGPPPAEDNTLKLALKVLCALVGLALLIGIIAIACDCGNEKKQPKLVKVENHRTGEVYYEPNPEHPDNQGCCGTLWSYKWWMASAVVGGVVFFWWKGDLPFLDKLWKGFMAMFSDPGDPDDTDPNKKKPKKKKKIDCAAGDNYKKCFAAATKCRQKYGTSGKGPSKTSGKPKKDWRTFAKQFHPDRPTGDEDTYECIRKYYAPTR